MHTTPHESHSHKHAHLPSISFGSFSGACPDLYRERSKRK
jgi:hypothetical protein